MCVCVCVFFVLLLGRGGRGGGEGGGVVCACFVVFLLFGRVVVFFLLFGRCRVHFFAVWVQGRVFFAVWAVVVFFLLGGRGGRGGELFFCFAVWAGDGSSLTYRSAWLVLKGPNNKKDQTAKKKHGFQFGHYISRSLTNLHKPGFHVIFNVLLHSILHNLGPKSAEEHPKHPIRWLRNRFAQPGSSPAPQASWTWGGFF